MIKNQIVTITALLLTAGCATLPPDGGMGAVNVMTRERIQQEATWIRTAEEAAAARAATRELLAKPLTAEGAVKVALLNNQMLQAAYAELGVAQAERVQAGRLRNPGFSFSRLARADEIAIERTLLFDVFGLITLPLRMDLENRRVALTQGRVAAEVLQAAADTRRAWYAAVAAQESAAYAEQVLRAAEAGAELARRMAAAGNFSKLDHAREQAFYADAATQHARARQNALAQRERLTRLLGLWGDDAQYQIPGRLPALPATANELTGIEARAISQRLDVRGAMQEAENLAAAMGLTRATGFINVFEAGYHRNSESHQPRQTGYEIELRLPLFDWGDAKVARAEYLYMQAVSRAAGIAVRARSEVREAYAAYRTTFDLALHYRDEIVPLRKHISEEVLLRYNGNLMSVFELLADARQQIAAVSAAIDAQRDFWLADASFNLALTGLSPGAVIPVPGSAPASAAAAAAH